MYNGWILYALDMDVYVVQSNPSPWDPATVFIIEVSLFQRFIYIVVGPQLTVLIIEVSLFQSVHNSRFDYQTKLAIITLYVYLV